jgi:hypothetical protein
MTSVAVNLRFGSTDTPLGAPATFSRSRSFRRSNGNVMRSILQTSAMILPIAGR